MYALFAGDDPQAFADIWVGAGSGLWWVYLTASAAAAVLVALCWVTATDRFRRPLAILSSGLLLTWLRRLLTDWLDVWGFNHVAEVTPDVMLRATVTLVVDQAIDVVAAGLMITGAVLLRRAESMPAPDNA